MADPASTDAAARRPTASPRRVAFAVLAAFILLGPAPGHLFGIHSVLLRNWIMFSGAGVGLLKGQFTLHRADGAVTLSPIEAADLPSYLALPIDRRIYKPADLKTFAARICGDVRETARLSFDGSVGTFAGWRALTVDDVCNESGQVRFEEARP
jgi:hypothetical protein